MRVSILSKINSFREKRNNRAQSEASKRKRILSFIGITRLWRPYIISVPVRLRGAILQKELWFSSAFLKGTLLVWAMWWSTLIIFSDTQKTSYRYEYIMIRLGLIAISLAGVTFLNSDKLTRTKLTLLSASIAACYMGSVVLFSLMPLPMRTMWLAIVPGTIIMTTASSGRGAFIFYSFLMTIGLLTFGQPINSINVVSDLGFGAFFIFAGIVVKLAIVNSEVSVLENTEAQLSALQNETKIVEAVEKFIPKVIRKRLREQVRNGEAISKVIDDLSQPKEQHLAVLYSDFRDYSKRSSSIEFIKNELILSSYPIIEFAEQNEAIVQNRGDSLLAAFMGDSPENNIARALLTGLLSSECEFQRVKGAGRFSPDRYMIVTSGIAVFCSLGQNTRQELTIAGKPVNLASRLDEITKSNFVKQFLESTPGVLFDFATKVLLNSIGLRFEYIEYDLKKQNIEVRTYVEEKWIYLLPCTGANKQKLDEYISNACESNKDKVA